MTLLSTPVAASIPGIDHDRRPGAVSASQPLYFKGQICVYSWNMTIPGDDTRWLDATAQAELVERREVTPLELVDAALERIEAANGSLNAVISLWADHARQQAATPPREGAPFGGVPFLLKDLWADYAGFPLTQGNAALKEAGYRSTTTSTLVQRYVDAGFVIAGRTNSPELGTLPVTEPLAYGPTRNPWNAEHTPGGSSGGAAAAVAAGLVPIAHASDGGGSIRIPAGHSGLVGLKPSQGRITLGPMRSETSLGVEHCLARSVRDTARLLDATCGPGVGDTVIAPPPPRPYTDELDRDPGTMRIGLLDHDPRGNPVHPDCVAAVHHAARLLEGLGHHVEPAYPAALADNSMTARFMAQWAANAALGIAVIGQALGRPATADDVEPVNWAQAEFARAMSAVDLADSLAASSAFRRAVQAWWADGWDLLLTPTTGEPPPRIGEHLARPEDALAGLRRAAEHVLFTTQFNLSGQPAISLPLHWTPDGLPIGVQLVAAYAREDVLIGVAAQLERAEPWHDRRPPAYT